MLQPGTTVGRYVVERQVGQGGMAAVYRVRDEDGRPWALKLLTMRKSDVSDRFRQEAEIQIALDHPHIVRGSELLDVDGDPALVMEFVDGPALDLWQQAHPTPKLAELDRIARQIVDAVAFAHAHGLVHRDLKPGNVMIEDRPEGPFAKVTDFGLAKLFDGLASTRTGVALGTPRYMAPEQIRDAKRVDARADVWSLGVVLYELYTGRPAFQREVVMDVFTAVVRGDYVDPGQFDVPPRVRDAIRGALVVEPAARFADCRTLLAALGAEPSFPPGTLALPVLGTPIVALTPPPAPVGPTVTSITLSPPSDADSSSEVISVERAPTKPARTSRPPPAPWPVTTWIVAWGVALMLVFALFAGGLVVLGGIVSIDSALDDRPR